MPQVLEKQRFTTTTEHLPRLFRSRVLDYTLLTIGVIAAAFGAYTYYAPSDWLWADLGEMWFLGAWVVGGAFLVAAFAMLGASIRDREGYWTAGAVSSFVVATLALVGAVTAAVVWII